jgi:protein-S-isoprenylcysteine O-methyltransferase Ste14
MAIWGLILYALFAATGFGWRSYLQWRRTGSTGLRGFHGRPGSLEWLAGAGFVVAIAVGVLAPVVQLAGLLSPIAVLDHPTVRMVGLIAAILGIATTLWAQEAMGASWRIGVDSQEKTTLVDNGVFGWVRNPIFAAMLVFGAGIALIAPNPLALAGFAMLVLAIQLQVRVVEEPYLCRIHGMAYTDYSSRVGRFVPGLGRLQPHSSAGTAHETACREIRSALTLRRGDHHEVEASPSWRCDHPVRPSLASGYQCC